MVVSQNDSSRKSIDLHELISPELNLIKVSDTMGGALIHFASLFNKIRMVPSISHIIATVEAELAEEDQQTFETLEKAVLWFHEKINILLPHVDWEPDSFKMVGINVLLNYQTISFGPRGYIGSLYYELKCLWSEVDQTNENEALFEGWTKIEASTGLRVFDLPSYVDAALNPLSVDEQIYQWKEKADTQLSYLLRFLKLLTLYETFVPLVLGARPDPSSLPQNLRELVEREYRAHAGYYLSLFRSHDSSKHPLTKTQLIGLVDRLAFMMQKELERPAIKGPAAKKRMSELAEKFCVKKLVEHIAALDSKTFQEVKKWRYEHEVFDFLHGKAKENNSGLIPHISKTMVKERAGPEANRVLLQKHNKVWRKIPSPRE